MLGSTLALNAGLISMIIGQLHPEVGADGVHMMGFETRLLLNANENYQIIFPPSTQWVASHAKREFASWPIARSRYAGADFTAGVDVSWYKNHVNSNSMFAWNYTDDFFAGYDHGRQAGTLSVADHHIVPGKKFWTWGRRSAQAASRRPAHRPRSGAARQTESTGSV